MSLTHGAFAKEPFKVIFSPKLSLQNQNTGIIRNLRRSGIETYRTLFKINIPRDSLSRSNPNYKAQRKIQRKASIVAHTIESFSVTGYSVTYSPEIFLLSSELVTCSIYSPEPLERARGITSPRNMLLSPRSGKYDYDIDGSPSALERSKSRKKFGFQFDRSEKREHTSPDYKPSSKSSFLPNSSKLRYPFKQVSRLWGSQRLRQTTNKTPSKKNSNLQNFFEDEFSEKPVSRRKVRSRSVPNLEALMAMNDGTEDLRFLSPRPKSRFKNSEN